MANRALFIEVDAQPEAVDDVIRTHAGVHPVQQAGPETMWAKDHATWVKVVGHRGTSLVTVVDADKTFAYLVWNTLVENLSPAAPMQLFDATSVVLATYQPRAAGPLQLHALTIAFSWATTALDAPVPVSMIAASLKHEDGDYLPGADPDQAYGLLVRLLERAVLTLVPTSPDGEPDITTVFPGPANGKWLSPGDPIRERFAHEWFAGLDNEDADDTLAVAAGSALLRAVGENPNLRQEDLHRWVVQ